MKIRKFKPKDLKRILEIENACFPIDAYSEKRFLKYFKQHPEGFIVAENQKQILGYAIGFVDKNIARIDSIAVDPKYQRKKIGQSLTKYLLADFNKNKAKFIKLEVRTTNQPAIKFYQKFGFKITKTLKKYYRDAAPAYLMKKDL